MRTRTLVCCSLCSALAGTVCGQALGHSVRVPLDYAAPTEGSASIYYEFGAPYDPNKPTVFVIADGQQFYLRKGRVAAVQKSEFGEHFNIVGVVGRADCPDAVKACKDRTGQIDWRKAYQYFKAAQWVDDIDLVRRKVVGAKGKICLFGESGGAFLAHQYLAVHGRFVSRAVTPSAVMSFWEGRLGLRSDRFWEEISPESRTDVMTALRRYASRRELVVQALQRQNFFVPTARIGTARADLIHALAIGNDEALATAIRDYQVDAIQGFLKSDVALPIRVRLFEFYVSAHEGRFLTPDRFYPNLENTRTIATPLSDLLARGLIAEPSYNFAATHSLGTETLVVSGVLDHTVDYRTSIALAASYPKGHLLLLEDDHELANLGSRTLYRIVVAFLMGGPTGKAYRLLLESVKPQVYSGG